MQPAPAVNFSPQTRGFERFVAAAAKLNRRGRAEGDRCISRFSAVGDGFGYVLVSCNPSSFFSEGFEPGPRCVLSLQSHR